MGAGASTSTTIKNEYNFSGNNNGITSGDQGVYGTTTGASTDVKPTSDMNYSPQINPDFGRYLNIVGSGNRAKILGAVSKTSNLIDSVRHIGAAAYRVAMGDDELIEKAKRVVHAIADVDSSAAVLDGSETVPIEAIKSTSDLQLEVVRRLPAAHDAYGALALGMTGMRNSELNTKPTVLALSGCYDRASEGEKLNSRAIIELAGPRMGVVPRNVGINSSTIIQETLDNTVTEHGNVGDLRIEAQRMADIQKRMKCSLLHATSQQLSEAGMLPTDSWETSEIIGMIRQHSVTAEKVDVFPGGFRISTNDMLTSKGIIDDKKLLNYVGLTPIALDLARQEHAFRDTYVLLTGRVTIYNQPLPPKEIDYAVRFGLAYINGDDNLTFVSAYYVNTEVIKSDGRYSLGQTNDKFSCGTQESSKPKIEFVAADILKKESQTYQITENQETESYFSFDSSFQLIANLSKMQEMKMDRLTDGGDPNFGPVRAFFVLAMGKKPSNPIICNVQVAPPIVRIETISNPDYMIFIGDRYPGAIIDLLGRVPEWYASGDHHDPVYLYKKLIEPIIPYLGIIANHHLEVEGAALELTRDHVKRALNNNNKPGGAKNASDDMIVDKYIRNIIIKIHEALYDTGPLKIFSEENHDKKIVFMHIFEKVINQSLTHINVWRDRSVHIRENYARDCKDFNAVELQMDKKRSPLC